MLCSIATSLDEAQLGEVKDVERSLGTTILAFSCHQLDAAALSEEQLASVRELESKLGVSLVAVAA